jgi:transcriptional regulator with XRE-family HTH domain
VAKPLSPLHQGFGRAIRQLRDERDLSQEGLGEKSGLHRNYVGGIERGELNPTLTTISKLAKGLGLRVPALLTLADKLEPRKRATKRR